MITVVTGQVRIWHVDKSWLASPRLHLHCWTLLLKTNDTGYEGGTTDIGANSWWVWLKLHHLRRRKMNHCMVAAFIIYSNLLSFSSCFSLLVALVIKVVGRQVRIRLAAIFWLPRSISKTHLFDILKTWTGYDGGTATIGHNAWWVHTQKEEERYIVLYHLLI